MSAKGQWRNRFECELLHRLFAEPRHSFVLFGGEATPLFRREAFMKRLACVFVLNLCFVSPVFAASLPSFGIDIYQTSVSGVSSGGAMAVQMHVAHSSIMRGVGVIAGVAYGCVDPRLPLAAPSLERRPCLYAIRMAVASRWPHRFSLAASMSFSTSRSVRYSRGRLEGRRTVTFTAVEGCSTRAKFSMIYPYC
jgi:hypothetical protein